MEALVKITDNNGKKAVSARELYEGLGYNTAHWAKWYKKNIESNQFAIENEDWAGFALSVNGNETKDFILSIDFAKKLSMLARTEKGEQIRNYFIEVERQSNSLVPTSFKEALMLAVRLEEEKEQLALEVAAQKPFVKAFERVIDAATTYTLDTVSDILNIGRTTLSNHLKSAEWAMQDSTKGTASTRYAELQGYAKTVFETIIIKGAEKPVKKIVITKKGLDKLVKLFNQN